MMTVKKKKIDALLPPYFKHIYIYLHNPIPVQHSFLRREKDSGIGGVEIGGIILVQWTRISNYLYLFPSPSRLYFISGLIH